MSAQGGGEKGADRKGKLKKKDEFFEHRSFLMCTGVGGEWRKEAVGGQKRLKGPHNKDHSCGNKGYFSKK